MDFISIYLVFINNIVEDIKGVKGYFIIITEFSLILYYKITQSFHSDDSA